MNKFMKFKVTVHLKEELKLSYIVEYEGGLNVAQYKEMIARQYEKRDGEESIRVQSSGGNMYVMQHSNVLLVEIELLIKNN